MWRKSWGKTILVAALLCASALPASAAGSDGTDRGLSAPRPTVVAGAAYTLQLETDGTVWVFGEGPRQDSPQIGRHAGGSLEGIVQVSPGDTHAAAVDVDGRVWVWGDNESGQLGQGDKESYSGAVSVPFAGTSKRIVAVAAGYDHTLALGEDGTVWAWGDNTYGQLGNKTVRSRSKPARVMNGSEPLDDIVAVAAGRGLSYALSAQGEIWSWGDFEKKDGSLQRVMRESDGKLVPLGGIASIAAGYNHALALAEDGSLYAWGSNREGQLGIGSDDVYVEHANAVGGNVRWAAIAAGSGTSAGIDEEGRLWVWGATFPYQNRKLEQQSRNEPRLLSDENLYTDVSVGGYHGVAMDDESRVWVWGDNDSSQLGHAKPGWSFDKPVLRNALDRRLVAPDYSSVVVKESLIDGEERIIRLQLWLKDPTGEPLIYKWPTAELKLTGIKPIIAPFVRPVSFDGYYRAEIRVPRSYDLTRMAIGIQVDGATVTEVKGE